MGLLDSEQKNRLINLLLRLPNIEYPEVRQQLAADALGDLIWQLPQSGIPDANIRALVSLADNQYLWANERPNTLLLCDAALHRLESGIPLYIDFQQLRTALESPPIRQPVGLQRRRRKSKGRALRRYKLTTAPISQQDRTDRIEGVFPSLEQPLPVIADKPLPESIGSAPSVVQIPLCGALAIGAAVADLQNVSRKHIPQSASIIYRTLEQLRIIKPQDGMLLTGENATSRKIEDALDVLEKQYFNSIFVVVVGRSVVSRTGIQLYEKGDYVDLSVLVRRLESIASEIKSVCLILDIDIKPSIVRDMAKKIDKVILVTWRARAGTIYIGNYFRNIIETLHRSSLFEDQSSKDLSELIDDKYKGLLYCITPRMPIVILPKLTNE